MEQLQEHAHAMERLGRVAYAGLPAAGADQRTIFSLLGEPWPTEPLVGGPNPTLDAAVRAGNEYLQLTASHPGPQLAGPIKYRRKS